jgi:signal recognition particle GTPase
LVHVTRQVLVPPGVPTPRISAATPIAELVAALNAQQPEVLVGAVGVWRALAEEQIAATPDRATGSVLQQRSRDE